MTIRIASITVGAAYATSRSVELASVLAILVPLVLSELKSRRDDRFRREAARAVERVAAAGGRGSLSADGGVRLEGTGVSTGHVADHDHL